MKTEEFKEFAKAAVEYVADYIDNIRERPVLSNVQPGYLRPLLPKEAPEEPEHWSRIFKDLDKFILPGVTHWHSPRFNAYYPTGHSFPSLVGDILSDGLGIVGFSWKGSPACTELELIVIDWLAKLLGLPQHFLNSHPGPGGGLIVGTASEATLMAMLGAREKAKKTLEPSLHHTLIAYASGEANSSVERSGLLAGVKMRLLKANEAGVLTSEILNNAVSEDKKNGLKPFCLVATLGSTSTCRFDPLEELGPYCQKEGIWLHVDAAYAGGALICEEYRHLAKGVEYADSFLMNPHKWLRVHLDCSAVWFKNSLEIIRPFMIERDYLTSLTEGGIADLRHYEISLGRRFRSLKLWLTLRLEGSEGLRQHIRNHCRLAKELQLIVEADPRFQIDVPATMGLICFSLKGEEALTEKLLEEINQGRKLFILSAKVGARKRFSLRYVICSAQMTDADIREAWKIIATAADKAISSLLSTDPRIKKLG